MSGQAPLGWLPIVRDYVEENGLDVDSLLIQLGAAGQLAEPHDGESCAETERRLDDAVGELNEIGLWLARYGLNPRQADGSYDVIAALDGLMVRAAGGAS